MIDKDAFLNKYWNYYLVLENDLISTKRYIEIDSINCKAFSIEYLKQYQIICSEIDVVLKEYCKEINPKFKGNNITQYCKCINNNDKSVINDEVIFNKNTILIPWKNWVANEITAKNNKTQTITNNPFWWTTYNKIKHYRTAINKNTNLPYYKYANQENIYNALAGLFVIEMEYYKLLISKDGENDYYPPVESTIFEMKNWTRKYFKLNTSQYEVVG